MKIDLALSVKSALNNTNLPSIQVKLLRIASSNFLRRCGHWKANQTSGRTQWWFNCTREKENHQNFQTRETSIQRKPFQNSLKGLLLICQKKNSYKDVLSFTLGESQGTDPKEHLFTVKSVISLYMHLQLPLYLQLYDISTYFDKEILRDAMDTLFSAGITGKLYRLWFMMAMTLS